MEKSSFSKFSRWVDISKINRQPQEKDFFFFLIAVNPTFYSKENLRKYFIRLQDSSIRIDGILGSLILLHKESAVSQNDIDLLKGPNVKFVYFKKKCIYDNVGSDGRMLFTPVVYFEDEILNMLSHINYGEWLKY